MAKAKAKKTEIVRGFKGFDKDLQCRGMQYEVGKTHKHKGPVTLCGRGFHFCEYPLDVLYFYPPADSRYAEVSGEGVSTEKNDGTKRVCQRLMVNAEIGIPGLVKAAVQYVLDNVTTERVESNTGDWSAATNTGHWSAATNTGHWSAATNTGHWSAATNTGDQSAAEVRGAGSVAMATGYGSKVRGALGCGICCVERDGNGKLVSILSALVDGGKIKADTWYAVQDGEFVEVE